MKRILILFFIFSVSIKSAQMDLLQHDANQELVENRSDKEIEFINSNTDKAIETLTELLNEITKDRNSFIDQNLHPKEKLAFKIALNCFIKNLKLIIEYTKEHLFEKALGLLNKLNKFENSLNIFNKLNKQIENPKVSLENIVNLYAKKISNAIAEIGTNFPEDLSHLILTNLKLNTFELIKEIEATSKINYFCWSPDNKMLAVSENKSINIYDTTNWQCIKTIQSSNNWRIAWSPDGQMLAIITNGSVFIYNSLDYKLIKNKRSSHWATNITWSHNSQMLAVTYAAKPHQNFAKILNTNSWQTIKTLNYGSLNHEIVWSRDDRVLVTGRTTLWDINSGICLKSFESDYCHYSMVWLHNIGMLASCNFYGAIKIWDPKNGNYVSTLEIECDTEFVIMNLSFNGKTLASCYSSLGKIKIWDIKTFKCIQNIEIEDRLEYIELSYDDTHLAVSSPSKIYIFQKTLG